MCSLVLPWLLYRDANTIAPTRREVLNKLTWVGCYFHSFCSTHIWNRKGLHENSKEIRRKITLKINLARREGDERKANKLQQHLDDHRDSTSKPVVRFSIFFWLQDALMTMFFSSVALLIQYVAWVSDRWEPCHTYAILTCAGRNSGWAVRPLKECGGWRWRRESLDSANPRSEFNRFGNSC